MRTGNSSYDNPGSSHNPDKSYELASWQDYSAWLVRTGHDAEYTPGEGIRVTNKDGSVTIFTTKKAVYVWLLESDGEKYV